MGRWSVRFRRNHFGVMEWRIYDSYGAWWDRAESLRDAHDEATRQAIFEALNRPHGLLAFVGMLRLATKEAGLEAW